MGPPDVVYYPSRNTVASGECDIRKAVRAIDDDRVEITIQEQIGCRIERVAEDHGAVLQIDHIGADLVIEDIDQIAGADGLLDDEGIGPTPPVRSSNGPPPVRISSRPSVPTSGSKGSAVP